MILQMLRTFTFQEADITLQEIAEDFYNFVELLCPTSITSGIAVAETLLMIFPLE